ncbi:hypothetical protein [Pseudoxanthomonas mexicana]
MHPATLTRSALFWFLVVTFFSTVLLNMLAFASPFVATLKYPEAEQAAHAKDLMDWATKRLPWLVPLYLIAVWKLAQTLWPRWIQVVLMGFAITVLCLPLLQKLSPPAEQTIVLQAILVAGKFTLFFTCTLIVWRNLKAIER